MTLLEHQIWNFVYQVCEPMPYTTCQNLNEEKKKAQKKNPAVYFSHMGVDTLKCRIHLEQQAEKSIELGAISGE